MDRILKAARTSGSLNLSNRSLRDVPTEVYQCLETTTGEGENWWETVDLQKLILAHNDIEVLREDLKNLSCLVVLNVSHNKLSGLPAAIGQLTPMKSLDVSFNSISKKFLSKLVQQLLLSSSTVQVIGLKNCQNLSEDV